MRVALINPCNIWFAPYLNIYTSIFEKLNIEFDIISWNKEGNEENIGLQYEKRMDTNSQFVKFIHYYKYASFVKNIVKKNNYDRLVVVTSQAAIFINKFLEKNYKGRYIFDYRDLSIEQKGIFKSSMKNVLNNSYSNVVSSPGFLKCLPTEYNYYLSHNFDIDVVKETLDRGEFVPFRKEPLNVLTIGGIRDYSSNIEVVDALANKDSISIDFVGKGPASEPIKQYLADNKISNANCVGFYKKEDEAGYIKKASYMNIYYPSVITHDTAMSNRFYNALIHKKPMIVKSNSIQGDYVEKYRLGLSLSDCNGLHEKLKDLISNENEIEFNERCNILLREFVNDYEKFYNMVKNFVNE